MRCAHAGTIYYRGVTKAAKWAVVGTGNLEDRKLMKLRPSWLARSSKGTSAGKHECVRMENQQCFCQYLKQSHQWYLDPLAVLDLKLVQVLHA